MELLVLFPSDAVERGPQPVQNGAAEPEEVAGAEKQSWGAYSLEDHDYNGEVMIIIAR